MSKKTKKPTAREAAETLRQLAEVYGIKKHLTAADVLYQLVVTAENLKEDNFAAKSPAIAPLRATLEGR